jgi:TIR domain
MPSQPPRVFISYSRKDKRWRDDLDTHLKPYLPSGSIVSWSDEQIAPGSEWFSEIRYALANSKVAVLLVSPDFLASDFIHEHELGPLLEEAEQGGVKIFWVPVRESDYKQTPLKNHLAILDPGKPLAGMTEAKRDQAWVRICVEIEKAVNDWRLKRATIPGPEWDACTGLGTPAGTAILCREAEAKERLEPERREVSAPVSEASQPIDRVKNRGCTSIPRVQRAIGNVVVTI